MRFELLATSARGFTLVVAALTVLSAGCGPAVEQNQVVPVTGRVFVGEVPLEFGQVVFQPVSGGQPASGSIDGDGKFILSTYSNGDGAALGKHRVRIVSYSSQDPKTKKEDGPQGDSLGELLTPQKYSSFATSGLEVSVLAGGNAPFVFKLDAPPADPEAESEADDPPQVVAEDSAAETAEEESPLEDAAESTDTTQEELE